MIKSSDPPCPGCPHRNHPCSFTLCNKYSLTIHTSCSTFTWLFYNLQPSPSLLSILDYLWQRSHSSAEHWPTTLHQCSTACKQGSVPPIQCEGALLPGHSPECPNIICCIDTEKSFYVGHGLCPLWRQQCRASWPISRKNTPEGISSFLKALLAGQYLGRRRNLILPHAPLCQMLRHIR